jgi:hypothetical protein
MAGMGQVEFLRALFETGQVKVGPVAGPVVDSVGGETDGESSGGPNPIDVVCEWDAANRLEFPGDAPALVPATAQRAVDLFYRACQFTVYRDVDAQTVATLFAEPVHESARGGPAGEVSPRPAHQARRATAADHYTVDLIFRFLPELFRLAHRTSGADPLCDGLRLWAGQWPLSSVGMSSSGMGEANPDELATVCDDGGLLRQYADRVIARRDVSRLADPRVRAAVQTALGYYDDLCLPVAKAIKAYEATQLAAVSGATVSDAAGSGDAPLPPS